MLHLDKVEKGDLLLLDREYPCFWLLFLLLAKGNEFCVRLKDDWWLKVKDFTESSKKGRIVKFSLPGNDRKKLADYPGIPIFVLKLEIFLKLKHPSNQIPFLLK